IFSYCTDSLIAGFLSLDRRREPCVTCARLSPCPPHNNRRDRSMKKILALIALLCAVIATPVYADEYEDAVAKFRESPAVQPFFNNAYAYAIFPTVGKGGVGIGGAYGTGRVYRSGSYVGDVWLAQVTIGWQLGGQTFSELIFFKDKEAFDWFTHDSFSFDAQMSAVAIAVGGSAQAGTTGASAGA